MSQHDSKYRQMNESLVPAPTIITFPTLQTQVALWHTAFGTVKERIQNCPVCLTCNNVIEVGEISDSQTGHGCSRQTPSEYLVLSTLMDHAELRFLSYCFSENIWMLGQSFCPHRNWTPLDFTVGCTEIITCLSPWFSDSWTLTVQAMLAAVGCQE